MEIKLAGCVILDKKGKILLLHRYVHGYDQWEIPGGKLEKNETAEAAAIREAREELGVEVELVRQLGDAAFTERDKNMQYTWFLAATEEAPSIQEPATFDRLTYFSRNDMRQINLSSGAACFVSKLDDGTITLIPSIKSY